MTPCNFCGNTAANLVNRGRDLQLDRPGEYALVRCVTCGLVYQHPQIPAAELADYYPDSYLSYPTDLTETQAALLRADKRNGMRRRCVRVEQHAGKASGAVLDVGCATGEFLDAMRERGWETVGVEFSDFAASYAREQLGLDVRTGSLANVRFDDGQFDVVTMWDVLEHVPDPSWTLGEIARILKPGGLLVAMTPNAAGLEARIFGRFWAGWDRPRHLHVFTPTVLQEYLNQAGFHEVEIISFSGRLSVTLLSLRYWLTARGWSLARAERLVNRLYNLPLRLLTLPLYLIAERLNQTTGMTAFATLRDE